MDIERFVWCGDSVGFGNDEYCPRGDAWTSTGGDASIPDIHRPIGFIRRKPVVRVKAGSQPIIKDW